MAVHEEVVRIRPGRRDVVVRLWPWGFLIGVGLLVTHDSPLGTVVVLAVVVALAVRLARARVVIDGSGISSRKWRDRTWAIEEIDRVMRGEPRPQQVTLHPRDGKPVRLVWWAYLGRSQPELAALGEHLVDRAAAVGISTAVEALAPPGPGGREEVGFVLRVIDADGAVEARARRYLQVVLVVPVALGLGFIGAASGEGGPPAVAFGALWTLAVAAMWARTFVALIRADAHGISGGLRRSGVAWAEVRSLRIPADSFGGRSSPFLIVTRTSGRDVNLRLDPAMGVPPHGGGEADRRLLARRIADVAERSGVPDLLIEG